MSGTSAYMGILLVGDLYLQGTYTCEGLVLVGDLCLQGTSASPACALHRHPTALAKLSRVETLQMPIIKVGI